MMIFANSIGLATAITLIIACVDGYKNTHKYMYLPLGVVYTITSILFVLNQNSIMESKDHRYVLAATIITWLILLWGVVFGKKKFQKDYKYFWARFLLYMCDINYKEFKKLSKDKQVELLENAHMPWTDGTMQKLIKDESDWDLVRIILNEDSDL